MIIFIRFYSVFEEEGKISGKEWGGCNDKFIREFYLRFLFFDFGFTLDVIRVVGV